MDLTVTVGVSDKPHDVSTMGNCKVKEMRLNGCKLHGWNKLPSGTIERLTIEDITSELIEYLKVNPRITQVAWNSPQRVISAHELAPRLVENWKILTGISPDTPDPFTIDSLRPDRIEAELAKSYRDGKAKWTSGGATSKEYGHRGKATVLPLVGVVVPKTDDKVGVLWCVADVSADQAGQAIVVLESWMNPINIWWNGQSVLAGPVETGSIRLHSVSAIAGKNQLIIKLKGSLSDDIRFTAGLAIGERVEKYLAEQAKSK